MKTILLWALALTMTAGATLANEPYLPRNQKALQRIDANKDGRINRDEIMPRMTKRFTAVDANGDKVVTVAEIDAMLQKRMEARRTRMMQLMDTNKVAAYPNWNSTAWPLRCLTRPTPTMMVGLILRNSKASSADNGARHT
jgi:hypothetical protein